MNSTNRPPDFPAISHQLRAAPQIREHYADLKKLIPEPTEGEIRLGGTRHKYKVLIDIYAIPPHEFGLNIWAPSDDARLRISRHRDMEHGGINVTLGAMKFYAKLETFVSIDQSPVASDV